MTNVQTNFADYTNTIASYVGNKRRMTELFATVPDMSPEDYQKTAYIFANKQYEEETSKSGPIPHGFFQVLDDSISTIGLLPTLRKYANQLNLVSETLKIDIVLLRSLLKNLRPNPKKSVGEMQEEQKARQQLREIFRKFNSVYKENYIKQIVAEKNRRLQETIIASDTKKVTRVLTPDNFVKYVFSTPTLQNRVRNMIFEQFYMYPSDNLLRRLLLDTTKKNYVPNMCLTLGIFEPTSWGKYVAEKPINRLESNFEPMLANMVAEFSNEEKEITLKIILYLKKCYEAGVAHKDATFLELKTRIKKASIGLLQNIARLMAKSNTDLVLENGKFVFVFPERISEQEKEECERYNAIKAAIKSVHDKLYKLYKKQNDNLLEFMDDARTTIPEEGTALIDKSKWLDSNKMIELINAVDINAINKMPDKIYNALRKFMIKGGLAWIYLAGNIDLNTMARIINNFESIYISMNPNLITIDNILEIVKKANLYDYVDDYMIALIGLDNLAKIINYNQFLGVPVTEEIIRQRIRKVIDLAERAENRDKSSLPFNCDVKTSEYSLLRYRNNDPDIFTCGIDTKTCFCVGVNENDFFFYSLLSKDGYVLKVVDKEGNLVARASCFRKNNVLMINGIRCLNNKVIPENQEELQQFRDIVELIKIMARKLIVMTSGDRCPIDYVICNQAGILENSYFEDKFEKVDSRLFREPVNIYNDEWQQFVHMYDSEKEQLLQEVIISPDKSFTTDFGSHYPALLLESRNNMGLFSPRDISMDDQEATYIRPRTLVEEFIGEEIDDTLLAKINRLRALDYHRQQVAGLEVPPFKLLTSAANIDKIYIGTDWCIIVDKNGRELQYYSRLNHTSMLEANQYAQVSRSTDEKDVKLYISLDKGKTFK